MAGNGQVKPGWRVWFKRIWLLLLLTGGGLVMNKVFNYPEKYEPGKEYIFDETVSGGGTFSYETPTPYAQPYRSIEAAEEGSTSLILASFYASQQFYHAHSYALERNKIAPAIFSRSFPVGVTYLIKNSDGYIPTSLQQGLDNWEYYRVQRAPGGGALLAEYVKVTNKADGYSIYNPDGSTKESRGGGSDRKDKPMSYDRFCYKEDGETYDHCPWKEEPLPDPHTRYGLTVLDRWRVMNADTLHYHGDAPSVVPKPQSMALPPLPLGSQVVTGLVCPQSGHWQAQLPMGYLADARQMFRQGDVLPSLTVFHPRKFAWLDSALGVRKQTCAVSWRLIAYPEKPEA